jgi:hypothetical protein
MVVDSIARYLGEVEVAVQELEFAYIERYEEEAVAPDRVNLRIRMRFPTGHMLELNEAIIAEGTSVNHLTYRYHFQDGKANLIFRYDNTPHFQHLDTFPHHKHLSDGVVPVGQPSIIDMIEEAKSLAVQTGV